MIQIAGATTLTFAFPASPAAAFRFYGDLVQRLADFLPHIELHEVHGPDAFRMCYHATELGAYDVRMFCDVVIERDPQAGIITVAPLDSVSPAPDRATLYSTAGQARYFSQSIFRPKGAHTAIDFTLDLRARLPVPRTMRFMPGRVVDGIANAITGRRIKEIAAGFIRGSRTHYAAPGAAQQALLPRSAHS